MYNQKVTKESWQKAISQPQIDYINIYQKSRMGSFPQLEEDEGQEFYGAASLYDSYLEKQIACVPQAEPVSSRPPQQLNTAALVENLKLALTAARFVPGRKF